jgi:hypothetical protein
MGFSLQCSLCLQMWMTPIQNYLGMLLIYADLVTAGIRQLTEIKKTIEKWPADEILSILVSFNRATSFFCILGEVLAMFTISFRPPRIIFQTCSDGVLVGFEKKY